MASLAASGGLIHVENDAQFQDELERAGSKLVVVDFFATWCGPCRFIAPQFETFSKMYTNAVFLKVDVDQCQGTAMLYGISAMPTFYFMRNKTKLDKVRGADPAGLEAAIKKHIQNSESKKDKALGTLGRSFDCFSEVIKNPAEIFMDVSELLIKFADNILKDPKNQKYRSVRLENKLFQKRLLPVPGAVECLFQMGFEEEDDKLVLPLLCPLENLHALREALLDECENIKLKDVPADANPPVIVPPPTRRWKPFIRNADEQSFYQRIISTSDHVFIYEDPKMLAYAASKIPLDSMRNEAKEKSAATKSQDGKVQVDERDCLLLLLLEWFKNKFFRWMDQPKCGFCDVNTRGIGRASPTEDDKRWGAGVVENYSCQTCNRNYTFPRYNHPQKLLETRQGRCGEWANCFTLCCRAAGFEARYILDWTDHVWTEVYSEHQKRWLHCDPCENVCDKPLLYEAGWGKKLIYVIAFSKDEVIDVTWRYTRQQKEILERRREVPESWLVDFWMNISRELQGSSTDQRRKLLEERRVVELVEFLSSKTASEDEKTGRQSGSLAWRSIRGETGPTDAKVNEKHPYIFVPTKEELQVGRLRIRYCAAADKYYRCLDGLSDNSVCIEGWQKGVESSEEMFRKVESDWKMVYLARNEGKSAGKITWRVKVEDATFVIDTVSIKGCSKSFENGLVHWTLSGDAGKVTETLPSGNDDVTTSTKFRGTSDIRVTASLSGGIGDVAWQHAQLFRQSLENLNECPLDITLHFTKK